MSAGPFVLNCVVGAVMSDDQDHRYWLWRIWTQRLPILVVCMFNPSKADARKNDPTISRLCHFAKAWGYGGILVINLHSLRSPDPDTIRLRERIDPGATRGDAHHIAWRHALDIAEQQNSPILVAWGNLAESAEAEQFLAASGGTPLICLGLTASGAPKHPAARGKSRVPDDQQPLPFWIAA